MARGAKTRGGLKLKEVQDLMGPGIKLPSYTVAQLGASDMAPTIADNAGRLVHCSNGAAGSACLAYCNGTNWLRVVFGAAVATS